VKYRARTNGNIVELSDEAARVLVPAGIYDAVDAADPPTTEDAERRPDDGAPEKPTRRGRQRK
jgi:hypothetical protein